MVENVALTEWFNVLVSKTSVLKCTIGSNPISHAIFINAVKKFCEKDIEIYNIEEVCKVIKE